MPEHATVQPSLGYIPPRFSPGLYRAVRTICPLYVKFALGVGAIRVRDRNLLLEAFARFGQRRTRLIVAFRHPHVDDAPLMAFLLGYDVWRHAPRRRGPAPFAHFIYDRGVPLWAGRFVGWLLPRIGAISIFRGKLDSPAIAQVRALLLDGDRPVALAPEGGVTYREDSRAEIEPGIAHFAFWCVADLAEHGRSERVEILPVTIHYRHGRSARARLERTIERMELDCGLKADHHGGPGARLERVFHRILVSLEAWYARFAPGCSRHSSGPRAEADGPAVPEPRAANGTGGTSDETDDPTSGRIDALFDSVVEMAFHALESELSIRRRSGAAPVARLRRAEQAAWDRIYRNDVADPSLLAPLERTLADRVALQTSLSMRHLQTLDILLFLRSTDFSESSGIERLIEAAGNIEQLLARIRGGDIASTPRMGRREVEFVVGAPIDVTERYPAYRQNRSGAVSDLLDLVADALSG